MQEVEAGTLQIPGTAAPRRRMLTARDWRVPAMLLALSLVPTVAGIVRLTSLSAGAHVTPENARFVAAPMPVAIHVVAVTLYCLLGAFQFARGFRLRWPGWHRRIGRILAVSGLLAAVSGLWMAHFYSIPTSLQGPLLYGVRLVVGASMLAAIVLAWRSILRRDVAQHEAWMIRAYALGQGAGTQVLVFVPIALVSGDVFGLPRDLLMSLAWGINAVFAEWLIRRGRKRPA
jgi:uncharacterized membrane protein YozB (DUF420 family)